MADGIELLVVSGGWFLIARMFSHRRQPGQIAPAAGQDVLTLVRQGRKIEAINATGS